MAALSELDCARFGRRIAKAAPESESDWGQALAFCTRHGVELLIARIDSARSALAQRMESDGARLADVLLQFRCAHLTDAPPVRTGGFCIRACLPLEADRVRELARACFRGYASHYHADPRLERDACDEVYADWAYRACSDRKVAEEVLLAEENAQLLGFAALRLAGTQAEGSLFGVAPGARGRGIQRALLAEFLAWAARRGAASATYQTQLGNVAAQKTVVRAGFEPDRSFLTFHLWIVPRSED